MRYSERVRQIAPSMTLTIDSLAKTMKKEGKDVVNFGAGEPDFDTPRYVKDAAIEAVNAGKTKYTPAPGIPELRDAIAGRYNKKYGFSFTGANVVVSTGAKQALFNAIQATVNPGDEVIIFSPYWVTYPEIIKMAGGVPMIVETEEEDMFVPKRDQIEAKVTDRTVGIMFSNPSNPCGKIYDRSILSMIADVAVEHDLVIISDEIYDELCYDREIVSIAALSEDARSRTVIVNGMSKSYAMTGWRMGYTIADEQLTKYMSAYQSHSSSNPNSIAQYASLEALKGPQEDLRNMAKVFSARADLVAKLYGEIPGLSFMKPEGAFYTFPNISSAFGKSYKGQKITDSASFCEILLNEKMVAVVPGKAFGYDKCFRLSFATSEENIVKGLTRIREFFSELE